jgi:CDP-diglyceride synthetase
LREHFFELAVYAIASAAITVPAIRIVTPPKDHEDLAMSDVVYTITVFHTLAAVSIFGFMIFSVLRRMNGQKD